MANKRDYLGEIISKKSRLHKSKRWDLAVSNLREIGSSQKSGHTEQPSCMRQQEVFHHGKTV